MRLNRRASADAMRPRGACHTQIGVVAAIERAAGADREAGALPLGSVRPLGPAPTDTVAYLAASCWSIVRLPRAAWRDAGPGRRNTRQHGNAPVGTAKPPSAQRRPGWIRETPVSSATP